jgi:hypothetical protein
MYVCTVYIDTSILMGYGQIESVLFGFESYLESSGIPC